MDRELKRKLFAVQIPDFDESALKTTIQAAKRVDFRPARYRMTCWHFFVDQLRFIRRTTWAAKIIFTVLALSIIGLEGVSLNHWVWPMIAISGPLLCLINANEIYQTFQPGLMELQMTTRYGCGKVLWVRLVTFGVCDLIFLSATVVLLMHSHSFFF